MFVQGIVPESKQSKFFYYDAQELSHAKRYDIAVFFCDPLDQSETELNPNEISASFAFPNFA